VGVSFLDISTGEFLVAQGTSDYVDKLLGNFSPKDVLLERSQRKHFEEAFTSHYLTFEMDDWMFTYETAHERLVTHFETQSLKGFGVAAMPCGIVAAGVILQYLDLTQHTQIKHITTLSRIEA
jgi:DNA mismatch repair protein MutS